MARLSRSPLWRSVRLNEACSGSPRSPFLGRSDYSRIADHPLATQLIYQKIVLLPLCDKMSTHVLDIGFISLQRYLSGQYRAVQNCLYEK
jgi:hypothetical protein